MLTSYRIAPKRPWAGLLPCTPSAGLAESSRDPGSARLGGCTWAMHDTGGGAAGDGDWSDRVGHSSFLAAFLAFARLGRLGHMQRERPTIHCQLGCQVLPGEGLPARSRLRRSWIMGFCFWSLLAPHTFVHQGDSRERKGHRRLDGTCGWDCGGG